MDAYRRIMHNGVKETLIQFQSAYWLRQFVHKVVLNSCLTFCRVYPSPPLPDNHSATLELTLQVHGMWFLPVLWNRLPQFSAQSVMLPPFLEASVKHFTA